MKHISALCEQNAELPDIEVCSNHVETFITYSNALTHSVLQEQQMAVKTLIVTYSNVKPCSLVDRYQRFSGKYSLSVHERTWKQKFVRNVGTSAPYCTMTS